MRRILLTTIVLLAVVLWCGRPAEAQLRPVLEGSIDQSRVPAGSTVHITYSTVGATGCQYGIRQWGSVIGWSDGIPIPTNGVLQITPALPGSFTVTIVAARRRVDLNRDGKFDGHRRTVSLSFPITVTALESPWNGWPDLQGKLWFDPSAIRLGEATTRNWTSAGGTAYLDGQQVPANGRDVLRPAETLQSILQVTSGRRWRFVVIERATITVSK